MRCLLFILLITLLGSCGNKIDNFTYAGKKVVQTVNVCNEAAERICNEASSKPSAGNTDKEPAEADLKASGGWDTRMMLR